MVKHLLRVLSPRPGPLGNRSLRCSSSFAPAGEGASSHGHYSRCANRQRGFSLLEILIAFAILALSLGILLRIFSAGVNAAGTAEEYTTAVRIAESLMAETGVVRPLLPGVSNGLENRKYQWRVAVTPFPFTAPNLNTASIPGELFKIKVNVSWGGRQIELTTLRLAGKKL